MKSTVPAFVAMLGCAVSVGAAAQSELQTPEQKFSYALGFQVGMQLRQQLFGRDMAIDEGAFLQAIEDVLRQAEPQMSVDDMQAALQAQQSEREQQRAALAQRNEQAGEAFREANRAKEGVTETASGLQYRVISAGEGRQPSASDTVVVHYRGTLISGEEFDSSHARGEPMTFSVDGIIAGWQEALPLMKEGAKWEIVIPPELAYGERGAGQAIGPNATLVFEIELIEVK